MFQQLAPLLQPGTTLFISAAREDDARLRLTITPRTAPVADAGAKPPSVPAGADPSRIPTLIDTPVSIVATPEELDAELAETLTRFVDLRTGIKASLEALEATYQAAEAEASKRVESARGKGAAVAPAAAAAAKAEFALY